jgi:hypothetical protein
MGTTAEEQAALDRINQEAIKREAERIAAEDARKAAEAAKQQGQNSMIADGAATVGWPDNEVKAAPSFRDKVGGVLRGEAGDAALAAKLLNSGQAPLNSATAPAKNADGARDGVAGSPAAKPALGLG